MQHDGLEIAVDCSPLSDGDVQLVLQPRSMACSGCIPPHAYCAQHAPHFITIVAENKTNAESRYIFPHSGSRGDHMVWSLRSAALVVTSLNKWVFTTDIPSVQM